MPVDLTLKVENEAVSTHEGLLLRCKLSNEDTQPIEIPSPFDRSGAFRIHLLDSGNQPLRRMDRQIRQQMMSGGRIDASLDLDTLDPGEAWKWTVDLSSFHYPIPPGEFRVEAVYDYPPAGLSLRTGPQPVRVKRDALESLSTVRDNPVIDGLAMLLEADGPSGPEYFLRSHNYDRPVGAWYSSRVLEDEEAEPPFLASCNFFQTEQLDPFYQRWILWVNGGTLHARRYDYGRPTDLRRSAPLPEESEIIRSAVRTRDDELYVFFWGASGKLECHNFHQSGLRKVFEHATRVAPGTAVSIGGDEESFHMAMPWRGVLYDRISLTGKLLERLHPYRSLLKPLSIDYEPGGRRIKALFHDPPHGKMIQMAVVDFAADTVQAYAYDRLPLREELLELSFDQDDNGRFHLLTSTTNGKLYYFSEERGPTLVAEGEDRYFPLVIAPMQIYLGCYRRDYGYRFLQYRRRSSGAKFVGFEAHP